MNYIKQIFQLRHQGRSLKFIERELGVSRNTVRKYLVLRRASGRSIPDLLAMEDPELARLLLAGDAGQPGDERYKQLLDNYPFYLSELKRTGVTRWLLWSEYRQSHPDGYSYSQFCWHFQQLAKADQATMANLDHRPGDQLYVDFAGLTMQYVDPDTGEIHTTPVLIATLGMSQYSYVQALPSQRAEDFFRGLANALAFFGGSPLCIIPDNLKAAVIKSDRFEPSLNTMFVDFANHYRMAALPTRPACPQDKSLVETAVRETYRNIYAPLRNRTFFSLGELNQAIKEQLDIWHDKPFQNNQQTRRGRFEEFERPALQALPDEPFCIKKPRTLTVRKNSHVYLTEDKHYYSVPYTYIGNKVYIIYTDKLVHIYFKQQLVASFQRIRTPYGYTTIKEHLPSHHQYWLDRSPDWYRDQARRIGDEAVELIECIIAKRVHPEQAYRSCDGILALSRKIGKAPLLKAAKIALSVNEPTYSFVKRLIQNGMSDLAPASSGEPARLPVHKNIRGKSYYQKP